MAETTIANVRNDNLAHFPRSLLNIQNNLPFLGNARLEDTVYFVIQQNNDNFKCFSYNVDASTGKLDFSSKLTVTLPTQSTSGGTLNYNDLIGIFDNPYHINNPSEAEHQSFFALFFDDHELHAANIIGRRLALYSVSLVNNNLTFKKEGTFRHFIDYNNNFYTPTISPIVFGGFFGFFLNFARTRTAVNLSDEFKRGTFFFNIQRFTNYNVQSGRFVDFPSSLHQFGQIENGYGYGIVSFENDLFLKLNITEMSGSAAPELNVVNSGGLSVHRQYYFRPFILRQSSQNNFGYIPFLLNLFNADTVELRLLEIQVVNTEEVPETPERDNCSYLTFSEVPINILSKNVSHFSQKDHLYIATEQGAPVIKIVKNDLDDTFVFFNAGLPRLNVGGYHENGDPVTPPDIKNKNPLNPAKDDHDEYLTPRGSYSFAFVLRHEYYINNVRFLVEGPIFISKPLILEEPQLNPISVELLLPFIEAPLSNSTSQDDIRYSPHIKVDVYRTKKNGNVYHKLTDNEVVNEEVSSDVLCTDTKWEFNLSDDELSDRVLYITGGEPDKTPPPKDTRFCYQIGNVAYYATENRVYQSIPGEPEAVPETFFVEFDSRITGLSGVRDRLIIFTEKQVYSNLNIINRVGDGRMFPEVIHETAGCISNKSAVSIEDICIWFGTSGIYFTDGRRVGKISDHLNNFYEKHIFGMSNELKADIDGSYDHINRRLLWSVPYYDSNRVNLPQTRQLPFIGKPYHLVLDLKFSDLLRGMGVFNIYSGGNVYYPSAMSNYKNDVIFGTGQSYVLKFDKNTINDPSIDFAPLVDRATIVRSPRANNLFKQPILWHLRSSLFDLQIPINKNIKQWFISAHTLTDLLFKVLVTTNNKRSNSGPVLNNQPFKWNDENFTWGNERFVWDKTPVIDYKGRVEPIDRATFSQFNITNEITLRELAERTINYDGTLKLQVDLTNHQRLFSNIVNPVPLHLVIDRRFGEPLAYLDIEYPLFSENFVGVYSTPDIVFIPLGANWDFVDHETFWTYNISDDLRRLYLNIKSGFNLDRLALFGEIRRYPIDQWRLIGIPRNQLLHLLSYGYRIQGISVTVTNPAGDL